MPGIPGNVQPGAATGPPAPECLVATTGTDDIPLDPTMDLPQAEAVRVRADLAERVRSAGPAWRPVVEQHLREYGAWIDPDELERQRAAEERDYAARERRRQEALLDAQTPATRRELREVLETLEAIDADVAELAAAVVAMEAARARRVA
jgi:hypothetical protein